MAELQPRYLVLEVQTNADGTIGSATTQSFGTREEADKRYYTVLAAATTSAKPFHTAVLLTAVGDVLATRCYYHEIPEPEPDPEPTEGE